MCSRVQNRKRTGRWPARDNNAYGAGNGNGSSEAARTLYRQAKSKPKWKAWSLYADVCRREVLEAALEQVIANGGAPGIDGQRVESLKERKEGNELRERWLAELQTQLRDKTYRPSPVRRVYIPKANGKVRPLGIPTVRDRVVQTADAAPCSLRKIMKQTGEQPPRAGCGKSARPVR